MHTGGDSARPEPAVTLSEVAASLVFEHAPVVTGLVDTDETILAADGMLLGRLGYDPEDLVGQHVGALVPPPVLDLVRRGLAGKDVTETTLLDGRTWLMVVRPTRSDTGSPTGAVVVLTYADVAEVHRELNATESLNEQFAALIELSKDFIAIADLDGDVTFVNQAGRALVGLVTDEETLGRPTGDFFTDPGRDRSWEIEESVRTLGYWEGESHLHHFGTGEAIPVSVNSFLVTRSSDGAPVALATVQRDLRSRLQAERALSVRVQEQRAVAELGRQALALPLSDLMAEAVQLVHARYPTLVAGVLQRLPQGTASQMVASSLPRWDALTVPIDNQSLTGVAFVENRLMATDDVLADDRFPRDGTTTQHGMRSALSCPIPGGEHPWASSVCPARSPGTGPRTTSRSSSRWLRPSAPPYAGTSWRASSSTRRCTTR